MKLLNSIQQRFSLFVDRQSGALSIQTQRGIRVVRCCSQGSFILSSSIDRRPWRLCPWLNSSLLSCVGSLQGRGRTYLPESHGGRRCALCPLGRTGCCCCCCCWHKVLKSSPGGGLPQKIPSREPCRRKTAVKDSAVTTSGKSQPSGPHGLHHSLYAQGVTKSSRENWVKPVSAPTRPDPQSPLVASPRSHFPSSTSQADQPIQTLHFV